MVTPPSCGRTHIIHAWHSKETFKLIRSSINMNVEQMKTFKCIEQNWQKP